MFINLPPGLFISRGALLCVRAPSAPPLEELFWFVVLDGVLCVLSLRALSSLSGRLSVWSSACPSFLLQLIVASVSLFRLLGFQCIRIWTAGHFSALPPNLFLATERVSPSNVVKLPFLRAPPLCSRKSVFFLIQPFFCISAYSSLINRVPLFSLTLHHRLMFGTIRATDSSIVFILSRLPPFFSPTSTCSIECIMTFPPVLPFFALEPPSSLGPRLFVSPIFCFFSLHPVCFYSLLIVFFIWVWWSGTFFIFGLLSLLFLSRSYWPLVLSRLRPTTHFLGTVSPPCPPPYLVTPRFPHSSSRIRFLTTLDILLDSFVLFCFPLTPPTLSIFITRLWFGPPVFSTAPFRKVSIPPSIYWTISISFRLFLQYCPFFLPESLKRPLPETLPLALFCILSRTVLCVCLIPLRRFPLFSVRRFLVSAVRGS